MGIARSTYYSEPAGSADDTALVEAMHAIKDEFEAYGWRRMQAALRHQGWVVTEIPPGLPQIEYNERSGQWVPRGQVLRCHIDDDAEEGTIIQIDDMELDMAAFGRMLQVFSGFGMRIAFVDEEDVTEEPEILVREPDDD